MTTTTTQTRKTTVSTMPTVARRVAAVVPLLLQHLCDRRAAGAGLQVGSGRPQDAGAEEGDSADDPPGAEVVVRSEVPELAVEAARLGPADLGDLVSHRRTYGLRRATTRTSSTWAEPKCRFERALRAVPSSRKPSVIPPIVYRFVGVIHRPETIVRCGPGLNVPS